MITLICCATLWVLWLTSSKRTRRWVVQPLIVVMGIIVLITSPMVVNVLTWGLVASLPQDSGAPVDAIVVLGRGPDYRDERLVAVWELWQSNRAPSVFSSGMLDAKFMVKQLETDGIPETALTGEECSQTTEENAAFSSAILRPEGVKDILLVTDRSHMWRSLLVFRSFGFNVIPYATTPTNQSTSNWKKLVAVSREYVALAQYAITHKFQQRSPNSLDHPPPEIMAKITDWNCKVPRVERT